MNIHPPWRDQFAFSVYFIVSVLKNLTHFHNPTIGNRDVSDFSISAGAVDDRSVSYDEVVHRVSFLLFATPLAERRLTTVISCDALKSEHLCAICPCL